jgi:hypothetical protein
MSVNKKLHISMKGIRHVTRLRGLDYSGYTCVCKVLRLTKLLALCLSRPVTIFYIDISFTLLPETLSLCSMVISVVLMTSISFRHVKSTRLILSILTYTEFSNEGAVELFRTSFVLLEEPLVLKLVETFASKCC